MLLARVRGVTVLAFGALTMVLYFLVSLPVMLLTRSGDLPIWFARFAWSRSALWLAGVRIAMEPLPDLPRGPLIFASNHESALDIWVLLARLPRGVRFVAKAELFEIPIFGAYMRLGGHVAVDRRNHVQAVESLHHAAEVVRSGTSLIVFPEGTRSRDGRVHPFKKGPFVLAKEAGVPVVPVAVSGAGRVTPKNLVAIWPGVIRLAVGEPVDPAAFPDKTALLREIRRRVIALHRAIGGAGGDEGEAVAGRGVEGAAG
ncbi:MAG TPA: lysophospholipid acyltransferase family protein [Anaeromyxobacteraceae bacterium]|nr:lysophospholipid acyltransferase family protein [Anaeromyxobacteraceae bacterium]